MYTILLISIVGSIGVSAICSLMEAAIYAISPGFVRHKAEEGTAAGTALMWLTEDISKPISAILILNTISHTFGAAISGWAVGEIFGSEWLAVFSAVFTLAILYLSEILPKQIGVLYARQVSMMVARPLVLLVTLMKPFIAVSLALSRFLRSDDQPAVSQEEMISMAALGTEEGALDHFEGSVIMNVIGLDSLYVRDVLTPRVVVFRLDQSRRLEEIADDLSSWNFSRVPLFEEEDPDHLTSYVTQRDIYRELLKGNGSRTLEEIARPLNAVPELMRVDKLLFEMFEKKEHICSVVDEHGGLAGIITLEDIIEEVVGREIVDEYDTVSDLRTFAKILRLAKNRRKGKAKPAQAIDTKNDAEQKRN